ncbi:hypothetical protein ES703_51705 [subsurface metagenome]
MGAAGDEMNVCKKINKGRGPVIVDLDIPMHGAVKGPEEIEKTKGEGEHPAAKVQPVEPAEAKPAERVELSDGAREAILNVFIDIFKREREVDADALAERLGRGKVWPGGREITLGPYAKREEVDAFLVRMLEIGEMEKNDAGKYEFTKAGLDKYADKIFWYPAFRLMDNPFATFDAGTEHRADIPLPLISSVPMVRRVKSLFAARTSAIIEGERGCGKTAIIVYFEMKGENLTTVVSPRRIESIENAISRRVALKLGKDARIVNQIRVLKSIGGGIEEYKKYKKAVAEVGRGGHLFDIPDNLSHKAAFELANLCARILDEGGFVILLATLGQARMLKRLDTFARFPIIKFERPSENFFLELFLERVDTAKVESSPLFPFADEAIDKVAVVADHNPRRFIILCCHLLTEMREREADKPIDEKMVDELLKDKDVLAAAPIDVTEALQSIMRDLGSKGAGWVKLKVIRGALAERYGLDLKPETIGRRLTEMGYQRRYAPSAEYLASRLTRLTKLSGLWGGRPNNPKA